MAAANPATRPPSAAQGDKAPPPSPATAQLIDPEAEIAADIDATASDSTVLSQFQEIVQQAQNAQFYDVSQIMGQIVGMIERGGAPLLDILSEYEHNGLIFSTNEVSQSPTIGTLERRALVERHFPLLRLDVQSGIRSSGNLPQSVHESAASSCERERLGKLLPVPYHRHDGNYSEAQLRVLASDTPAQYMQVLTHRLNHVLNDLSPGYINARVGTLRRWIFYCIEARGVTPWREWPGPDDGTEDEHMLYFLVEASIRFKNPGSVAAAKTHVTEFMLHHGGATSLPDFTRSDAFIRKCTKTLAKENPLGRKVAATWTPHQMTSLCTELRRIRDAAGAGSRDAAHYAVLLAAITTTYYFANRTGAFCPEPSNFRPELGSWTKQAFRHLLLQSELLDGKELLAMHQPPDKMTFASAESRQRAQVPVLFPLEDMSEISPTRAIREMETFAPTNWDTGAQLPLFHLPGTNRSVQVAEITMCLRRVEERLHLLPPGANVTAHCLRRSRIRALSEAAKVLAAQGTPVDLGGSDNGAGGAGMMILRLISGHASAQSHMLYDAANVARVRALHEAAAIVDYDTVDFLGAALASEVGDHAPITLNRQQSGKYTASGTGRAAGGARTQHQSPIGSPARKKQNSKSTPLITDRAAVTAHTSVQAPASASRTRTVTTPAGATSGSKGNQQQKLSDAFARQANASADDVSIRRQREQLTFYKSTHAASSPSPAPATPAGSDSHNPSLTCLSCGKQWTCNLSPPRSPAPSLCRECADKGELLHPPKAIDVASAGLYRCNRCNKQCFDGFQSHSDELASTHCNHCIRYIEALQAKQAARDEETVRDCMRATADPLPLAGTDGRLEWQNDTQANKTTASSQLSSIGGLGGRRQVPASEPSTQSQAPSEAAVKVSGTSRDGNHAASAAPPAAEASRLQAAGDPNDDPPSDGEWAPSDDDSSAVDSSEDEDDETTAALQRMLTAALDAGDDDFVDQVSQLAEAEEHRRQVGVTSWKIGREGTTTFSRRPTSMSSRGSEGSTEAACLERYVRDYGVVQTLTEALNHGHRDFAPLVISLVAAERSKRANSRAAAMSRPDTARSAAAVAAVSLAHTGATPNVGAQSPWRTNVPQLARQLSQLAASAPITPTVDIAERSVTASDEAVSFGEGSARVQVVFFVDSILRKRGSGDNVEYKVRWKGYDVRNDTWEPASNMRKASPDSIAEFEQRSASTGPPERGICTSCYQPITIDGKPVRILSLCHRCEPPEEGDGATIDGRWTRAVDGATVDGAVVDGGAAAGGATAGSAAVDAWGLPIRSTAATDGWGREAAVCAEAASNDGWGVAAALNDGWGVASAPTARPNWSRTNWPDVGQTTVSSWPDDGRGVVTVKYNGIGRKMHGKVTDYSHTGPAPYPEYAKRFGGPIAPNAQASAVEAAQEESAQMAAPTSAVTVPAREARPHAFTEGHTASESTQSSSEETPDPASLSGPTDAPQSAHPSQSEGFSAVTVPALVSSPHAFTEEQSDATTGSVVAPAGQSGAAVASVTNDPGSAASDAGVSGVTFDSVAASFRQKTAGTRAGDIERVIRNTPHFFETDWSVLQSDPDFLTVRGQLWSAGVHTIAALARVTAPLLKQILLQPRSESARARLCDLPDQIRTRAAEHIMWNENEYELRRSHEDAAARKRAAVSSRLSSAKQARQHTDQSPATATIAARPPAGFSASARPDLEAAAADCLLGVAASVAKTEESTPASRRKQSEPRRFQSDTNAPLGWAKAEKRLWTAQLQSAEAKMQSAEAKSRPTVDAGPQRSDAAAADANSEARSLEAERRQIMDKQANLRKRRAALESRTEELQSQMDSMDAESSSGSDASAELPRPPLKTVCVSVAATRRAQTPSFGFAPSRLASVSPTSVMADGDADTDDRRDGDFRPEGATSSSGDDNDDADAGLGLGRKPRGPTPKNKKWEGTKTAGRWVDASTVARPSHTCTACGETIAAMFAAVHRRTCTGCPPGSS